MTKVEEYQFQAETKRLLDLMIHCLGALLCFEVARSLRREHRLEPVHIFVSATHAPHHRKRDEPLSTLPKAALIKKLHEFNGAPPEALRHAELMDLLLPTIRADFELCETYEYHAEAPLKRMSDEPCSIKARKQSRTWRLSFRRMNTAEP